MNRRYRVVVLSDIHYAGPLEQARGNDSEFQAVKNPYLRAFAQVYRDYIWLRNPMSHNGLLDRFLSDAEEPDYVMANGDYSCDSRFIGISDDAAYQSAAECLGKLRVKYGERFHAIMGDHELGKLHLFGAESGLRLASWTRATGALGLQPFWKLELGNYVLLGVTSTLIALPLFAEDMLPGEKETWQKLRAEHLEQIREAFTALRPGQRVLLFCHDPSALPYLWREDVIRGRLGQVERTIIGHLHTNLVFWKSRLLAGMPRIKFLGHGVQRMSSALNEARHWRPFNVQLCPSLTGCELLKDGGWLAVELDAEGQEPVKIEMRRMKR